jgi:tetratricopeptide (TPR) repeat protein
MNLASWRGKLAMHEILISTYSQILLLFVQNENSNWFFRNKDNFIIGIISSLIAAFIYAIAIIARKRSKALKPFFSIFNEKTGKLKPDDVLGIRASENSGFVEKFYFERNYDRRLFDLINKGKNVLVTGEPLSGKSRLIYNTLKALGGFRVWIPDIVDFDNSIFPYLKSKRKSIVLFDDMDKYIGKQNIEGMISRLVSKGFIILATCKNGDELEILNNFLTEKSRDTFQERLEIKRMDDEELTDVKEKAKNRSVPLKESQFNGTVGSLFYPLLIMKNRFDEYDTDRKCFLRAMKKLYMAGIYTGKADYSIDRAKRICESEGLRKEPHEWDSLMEELSKDGFVRRKDKNIAEIDDAYFQNLDNVGEIISFSFELGLDDVFDEMLDLFKDDAEALFLLGCKAWEVSSISHHVRSIKTSIKAYNEVLKVYIIDKYPYQYAMTQNNLGNAYSELSIVEDKAENCKKAIKAYTKALKVYTFDEFPCDYALTQNNLGNAYSELSRVEDKAENCKKAIKAYTKALKVYTFDKFPYQYATTQNNLGIAYERLSEVENKVENLKKAIKAYDEALKVYTFDEFPYDYAMTQNNLGTAYWTLSAMEAKAENLKKAIQSYDEALKVYTPDVFPYQYDMVIRSRDMAVRSLSE